MLNGYALMLQRYTIAKSRDDGLFFLASLMQKEPKGSRACITACHVHHIASVCYIQICLYLSRPWVLLGLVGSLLKETIEDLEWTAIGSNNSTVEVLMQRQPHRLSFTAQAAGSLQVCS